MNYVLIYLIGVIFSMTLTLLFFIKMHINNIDDDEDDHYNSITTILAFFIINIIWPIMFPCAIILYSVYFIRLGIRLLRKTKKV